MFNCSLRCQLLLSLIYIREKENIVAYAYLLGNDSKQSAIKFARYLHKLPNEQAGMLIEQIQKKTGIDLLKKKTSLIEQISALINNES